MLFNSLDFAIFLPIVFILYWFFTNKNTHLQNILLVFASYVFYGWWDWRFLILIFFSTLVDYLIGRAFSLPLKQTKRKLLLSISLIVNLGLLGFFKYYNFFLDNFISAFSFFGYEIPANTLNIILPVGISFYTFQTLSYSIDLYRKKIEPCKNFITFSAFVSFFPQLVAGPIERASSLLPQFKSKRAFNYAQASDGMKQILWGFFKKLVIADNCALYVNLIFNNSSEYSGSTLLLGAIFFAFQIYGDFSGYSDIAIGTAKLFGIRLSKNFAFPYFSRNIAEFWRRWHISLSTWFRDYLYIPLGGSRVSALKKIRNTFIIFIVSGFWHGANWTFILWGLLNALYFLPLLLTGKNRKYIESDFSYSLLPSIYDLFKILTTFSLTVIAWVFFRAENLSQAFYFIFKIFSNSVFESPYLPIDSLITLLLVLFLMTVEWLHRSSEHALELIKLKNRFVRWSFYSFIIFLIGMYMHSGEVDFIYFQF